MAREDEQFWYNLATGEVERGLESPAVDRAGPFATAAEAAKAPELMAERARAWAADEAADDSWGATRGDSAPAAEAADDR